MCDGKKYKIQMFRHGDGTLQHEWGLVWYMQFQKL